MFSFIVSSRRVIASLCCSFDRLMASCMSRRLFCRGSTIFVTSSTFLSPSSFCLAFSTLFATLPYPFTPAQLSLVSALTIGFPSFVLAMEPNKSRVEGHFLKNVIFRALPAAAANLFLMVGVLLFYLAFGLSEAALSTICTAVMGIVGLLMVHRTSKPYNKLRLSMMLVITAAFAVSFFFLKDFFELAVLAWPDILVLVVFALLANPVMNTVASALAAMQKFFDRRKAKKA